MFDNEAQISQGNERFSSRREGIIHSLIERIVNDGASQVLDKDIFQTRLRGVIRPTADAIISSYALTHEQLLHERSAAITGAIESGMAFGCYTHNAELDDEIQDSIQQSFAYTRRVMQFASMPHSDNSMLYNSYEAAMQHIDAQDALKDCIEPEFELVNYAAQRLQYAGSDAVEAFKLGYGFVRRAATMPYDDAHQRRIFNLSSVGVIGGVSEKFQEYCKIELVDDAANLATHYERTRDALKHFSDDPYIKRYFEKGQKLVLIDGVCKMINPTHEGYSMQNRYHTVGGHKQSIIRGTFKRFATSSLPSESRQKELLEATESLDAHQLDDIYVRGLYIELETASMTFGTDDIDSSDPMPLKQTVLIPVNIPGQQLIYQK